VHRRGTVTVREWSERWIARPDLRPRTRQLYRGLLERQVLPSLGDVELAGLSPSAVRAWYAKLMSEEGPGASTGAKAYRLLRAMLATAVSDEVIARNPCQLKGAGVERAPERPLVTVAQVEALAGAIVPRLRALILLGAWCGLRRGELLGLRRGDLDLLHEAVRIERAMNQFEDGRVLIGPPKSDAGRRIVAIPRTSSPQLRTTCSTMSAREQRRSSSRAARAVPSVTPCWTRRGGRPGSL
jgi:integrase